MKDDSPPVTDDSVRSSVRTDAPIPEPPFWGVRELDPDLEDVYPYLDRHVLFKLHWGGRGVKGEEWERLVSEDFEPRLERMWREQDYLHPKARVGYFPCNADGNELIVYDPENPDVELERLSFPRQPKHDRICLSDFFRPVDSGERDVVALQGVTVGPEVTELIEKLEQDGEFAEQLFTHGLGVQTAEGLAEWLHAEVRSELGIDLDQGRRYSWGYPACPDQSEHEKVWRLLGLENIGMTLSDGYAVTPEQSTVAIIAHHPQAVYFGMKSGFVPKEKAPDELIAGTERGGEVPALRLASARIRAMAELAPGSVVAGYRIEAVIGRGGMGVVYRATQLSLDRPVALKVIAPELAGDVTFRERFKRESRIAASIEHPNVIPVYEAGEGDGLLYLTMRYVEGTDLKALLEADGTLEPARAAPAPGAGGGGAGRGAPARPDAPRREAGERAGRPRGRARARLPHGLRDRAPRGRDLGAHGRPARSSGRSTTWRRSGSSRAGAMRAPTCTRSAASCSRCSPAACRTRATTTRRRCTRTSTPPSRTRAS